MRCSLSHMSPCILWTLTLSYVMRVTDSKTVEQKQPLLVSGWQYVCAYVCKSTLHSVYYVVDNGIVIKKKDCTYWNTDSGNVYLLRSFLELSDWTKLFQNDLQEFYSLIEFCNPGILGMLTQVNITFVCHNTLLGPRFSFGIQESVWGAYCLVKTAYCYQWGESHWW